MFTLNRILLYILRSYSMFCKTVGRWIWYLNNQLFVTTQPIPNVSLDCKLMITNQHRCYHHCSTIMWWFTVLCIFVLLSPKLPVQSQSCATEEGREKCIFPFTFKDQTYFGCTTVEDPDSRYDKMAVILNIPIHQ